MEEASWRREASRRSILKASGRRLGAWGKHFGDVWGTLQGSGKALAISGNSWAIWGVLPVSGH